MNNKILFTDDAYFGIFGTERGVFLFENGWNYSYGPATRNYLLI